MEKRIAQKYPWTAVVLAGQAHDPDISPYITNPLASLSNAEKSAWSDFVLGSREDGDWTKYMEVYPFLGSTLDSATLKAKTVTLQDVLTNTGFVGGDYDPAGGVTGGPFKYFKTGFIPASFNMGFNNGAIMVYCRTEPSDESLLPAFLGSQLVGRPQEDGTTSLFINTSTLYGAICSGFVAANLSSYKGLLVLTIRPLDSGEHALDLYQNGVLKASVPVVGGTQASRRELYVGTVNVNDQLPVTGWLQSQIAFVSVSNSLITSTVPAEGQAQIQRITDRVLAFMTALGRNV